MNSRLALALFGLFFLSIPHSLYAAAPDPSGTDTQGALYQANSGLGGWASGSTDSKGNWSAYKDPEKPSGKEIAANLAHAFFSINFVWTLICGFLVMFMQTGFALVETGLVRAKNAVHTMGMNILVYGLGMAGFFATGYALMCGGSNGTAIGGPGNLGGVPVLSKMATLHWGQTAWGLFGHSGFFLAGKNYDASAVLWFLFMMVFMDTAATIPTGALAERWKFKSFCLMSVFIGAIIYPIFGCWMWGGGWLAQIGTALGLGHGAVDFAGSSVVHLQGGMLALVLAKMLGPREGKYDKQGKPVAIPGHNIPMVVIGTLILAFGWFGFNAGSTLGGTDSRIGVIAANTMLASGFGALSALFYHWSRHRTPNIVMVCNGMLAGLVAITAPCAFVAPWAAAVVGAIAGVIVVAASYWIENLGIDDPVGAIAVHGVNGIWGMIALGLFADGTYGAGWNGVGGTAYLGVAGKGVAGLFYGDSAQLAAQTIACFACCAWNVAAGYLLFKLTGFLVNGNRVTAEQERIGLDIAEIGLPAYEAIGKAESESDDDWAIPAAAREIPSSLRVQAALMEELGMGSAH